MARVVKMPDGTNVRFGDEFDDAEIKALIEHKFPDFAQQFAPAPTERDKGIFGLPISTPGIDAGYQALGTPVTQEQQDSGEWSTPAILPISYNKDGQYKPAMPGFIDAIGDALTTVGKGVQGQGGDPNSPENIAAITNLSMAVAPGMSMASKGMLQASAKDLMTDTGQRLPKAVATSIDQSGMKASEVNDALAALGPEARLGDLSPSLQGRMASVANIPGRGADKIMRALMERNKGANVRIKDSITDTLGPEPIPGRVAEAIANEKKLISPEYQEVFRQKALSDDPFVDAQPIIDTITDTIPAVVGKTRTKLESVLDMLKDPNTGKPVQDPQIIFAVRQELDGMIGAETNTNTARILGDLRATIDMDLGTNVPGLKSVDAKWAEQAKQAEGFDYGKTVLRNGENPVHPQDFADKMGKYSNDTGVPVRIQEGMHADIRKIVGTTANNRIAMKQILKGEGSWNREKLETAFGKEKADQLVALFDREAVLQETENLVFGGSKTARLAAGMEGLTKDASKKSVIKALLNTDFADAMIAAGDKLTLGAMGGVREARLNKIAEALLSKGNLRQMGAPLKTIPGIVNNPAIVGALIEELRKKLSKPVQTAYDPNLSV